MKIEHKCYIGLNNIDRNNKVNIKSFMTFLEDAGGIHSDLVGYGAYDIEKTMLNWMIISWKIKFFKKPAYNEYIKVVTWSKDIQRLYAYRDFEVYNEQEELIAIASSKWVLVNLETKSITTPDENLRKAYQSEEDSVMDTKELGKLKEPEKYISQVEIEPTRAMIDVNNHVHNIQYLDFAYSALPDKVYYSDFNEVQIMYKKEIKLGEKIKALYSYSEEENAHIVAIKSEDESVLHSIIKLK